MNRFQDKVALITGAAGGIGAAAALRLGREGARMAIFDRKKDLLDETAANLRQVGAQVECFGVDQTDREAVNRGVAEVLDRFGAIDLLFANAGYGQFGSFLELTEHAWNRHVDVNLTGTFNVCQETVRAMVDHRIAGRIVLNASSGAIQHADHLGAYCATKAGVRALAIAMASELGNHRIRVNAVMPGVVETGMTAPMLADEDLRQAVLAETPSGRLGSPDDVAALVAFLLSDEAGFIDGESVLIDGGQTIHGHPRWFQTDYREEYNEEWKVGR